MINSAKSAFTMVEILVVVTIIGVLIGTAVISYGPLNKSSRDARRKADLEQIRAALEMYRSSESTANGQYPDFAEADCLSLNSIANFDLYLPQIPNDPKSGYSYICSSAASGYTIYSTLESVDSPSCGPDCSFEIPCEYAVGPYGKTCGP